MFSYINMNSFCLYISERVKSVGTDVPGGGGGGADASDSLEIVLPLACACASSAFISV